MAKGNNGWLVSPKKLVGLVGAEHNLLRESGGGLLVRFYFAAVLVLLASALSFFSVRFAVEQMFHNRFVEIVLSGFFFFLLLLLYVFLIHTFTKESDHSKKGEKENRTPFTFSNISRAGFIIFMGFVMAQPLAVLFSETELQQDVAQYRVKLEQEHLAAIQHIFGDDRRHLEAQLSRQQQLNSDGAMNGDIARTQQRLAELTTRELEIGRAAHERIQGASFFVWQIRRVGHYPQSWLVTLIIVVIFFLPGFLVYSISGDGNYYTKKRARERALISDGYSDFLQLYQQIFRDRYKIEIELFSRFSDPPFNKERKEEPKHKQPEDFFRRYCP